MAGDARWEKVEQIYNAALERPEAERAAFLGEACGGDEELRRELESLLGDAQRAGDFLELPAPEASVLAAGRRISARLRPRLRSRPTRVRRSFRSPTFSPRSIWRPTA